jgi:hypothetical protein
MWAAISYKRVQDKKKNGALKSKVVSQRKIKKVEG